MAESKANFVARLVRDPANPPALIVLSGYEGQSDKEKHARVYLDLQLSSYVDVPLDAVAHRESVSSDQSPLGGVYLWVPASAAERLSHGGARPHPEAFGPIGAPPVTPIVGCPPFTPLQGCPPFTPLHGCPPFTPLHGCPPPTPLQGCPIPTQPWGCPPPPTPQFGCPPPTPQFGCPPPTPNCPPTPACPTPRCPPTPFQACPPTPACPTPRCPPTIFCPPTPACPRTPWCPPTPGCPTTHPIACGGGINTRFCPSVVDGCPSAPAGCDWGDPRTPMIQPQDWGYQYGQQAGNWGAQVAWGSPAAFWGGGQWG